MGLIAMKRGEPMRPGGPVTAMVDDAQVFEWRKVGWQVVEVEKTKGINPNLKIDLDEMTVNGLRALAKDYGVDIPAALKNRDKIIAALRPAIEGESGPLD